MTSDDRFCAEMGKDWDVSPADHGDVRIYVYLKVSVCLSVYLILCVICIVYHGDTIAWDDFKKYTIFYI